jgi:hypothetical protein
LSSRAEDRQAPGPAPAHRGGSGSDVAIDTLSGKQACCEWTPWASCSMLFGCSPNSLYGWGSRRHESEMPAG